MVALSKTQIIQSIGYAVTEISRLEAELSYLRGQLGELSLVVRDWYEVQQSGDRREQPVQRSEYQAFQSAKEASKIIPAQTNLDWNTEPPRDQRPVGAVWHSGSWRTPRDKPNEVQGQVHAAGSDEPTHAGGVQLEAETPSCGADTGKDF